jgi:3-hydroxyisobutyrate dehydrogenase-like beta-hydroxyacid dehydrogenase
MTAIGLLHPGEMGSALGAALLENGHRVLWASEGRSLETATRAAAFEDAGSARELARAAEVVLSVCPPHAAREVAASVDGFEGIYVDANAISPATAREIGGVDGGIVGPPPRDGATTRLYLSGPDAELVASLFAGTAVEPRVLGDEVGTASAMKMAFAGWSKGTAALLLAIVQLAEEHAVADALFAEWRAWHPEVLDALGRARRSAQNKGWRFAGEMEEIAHTFAAAGLPEGFHRAAAEVFRGFRRPESP